MPTLDLHTVKRRQSTTLIDTAVTFGPQEAAKATWLVDVTLVFDPSAGPRYPEQPCGILLSTKLVGRGTIMLNSSLPTRRRWLITIVMVALAAIASLSGPSSRVLAAEPAPATVRLVVDYGDGVQVHFTALSWREGMTVLDALTAAKAHRHGISFVHHGSGSTAMVTKIGDLKNEGGSGQSKNWLYSVNDKPGEVGAGVAKLKPGDVVLWKFQTYDYNSSS